MKRNLLVISAVALSLAIAAPGAVRAQEQDPQDMPPPQGAPTPSLGERVRTNFEERVNNIRTNREYRNSILQGRTRDDSSDSETENDQGDDEDAPLPGRGDISSTTPITPAATGTVSATERPATSRHGRKGDEGAPEGLAQSLSIAFDNLSQIRDRLSAGIDAASANGADVSAAQDSLSAADAKLSIAKAALQAFASSTPNAATTTEAFGQTAKSALKDARDALSAAIKALIEAITP